MAETSGTQTPKTRSKAGKPSTRKPAAGKAVSTTSTTKKAATAKPTAKTTATGTKTAPKKTTRKATPRKTTATAAKPLSADERRRLIAEAAYLRAEQRGFVGGDPMSDWLAAEADIDASLRGPTH